MLIVKFSVPKQTNIQTPYWEESHSALKQVQLKKRHPEITRYDIIRHH